MATRLFCPRCGPERAEDLVISVEVTKIMHIDARHPASITVDGPEHWEYDDGVDENYEQQFNNELLTKSKAANLNCLVDFDYSDYNDVLDDSRGDIRVVSVWCNYCLTILLGEEDKAFRKLTSSEVGHVYVEDIT